MDAFSLEKEAIIRGGATQPRTGARRCPDTLRSTTYSLGRSVRIWRSQNRLRREAYRNDALNTHLRRAGPAASVTGFALAHPAPEVGWEWGDRGQHLASLLVGFKCPEMSALPPTLGMLRVLCAKPSLLLALRTVDYLILSFLSGSASGAESKMESRSPADPRAARCLR
jgi:hypothetical protein